jgi:hypothetical protein
MLVCCAHLAERCIVCTIILQTPEMQSLIPAFRHRLDADISVYQKPDRKSRQVAQQLNAEANIGISFVYVLNIL